MTYEEFVDFVFAKCMYETIYDDSDGRTILVIRMLDAYKLIIKWQGLTLEDMDDLEVSNDWLAGARWAEAKLKEKNT
jgi:hypothetical protein